MGQYTGDCTVPANTKLMLIDGNALVHRAFHAVKADLTTSSGELTNAVFGFANTLLKEVTELRPTHIVMAMDRPAPTFRHDAYAQYKATRAPTPTPLVSQFGRVRELADAMHIPICEVDGFEADDVLGTLALQAEQEHVSTVIVTGDLDALQLVSDGVSVLTPSRGISDTVLYDQEAVKRRFDLAPSQLPDWKALVGDTSDNIPGVPNIGPKTASTLLAKYHHLEGVYAHLGELPERQRAALEPNRDQAFQSRELARIVRDAPVRLDLASSAFADVDRTKLINLLIELEFRSLIPRVQELLPAGSPPIAPAAPDRAGRQLSIFEEPSNGGESGRGPGGNGRVPAVSSAVGVLDRTGAQPPETRTRIVQAEADLDDLIAELAAAPVISVDTETTDTDPLRARLVGLSFSTDPRTAWYVPVGHASGTQLPLPDVLHRLARVLSDEGRPKVGHNVKYDYTVLAGYKIPLRGLDFDTMIAAYLARPTGRGLSLSALALERLGVEMTPIESLIGKGRNQLTMDLVDIPSVAKYAGADASVTLQLRNLLDQDLRDRSLYDLFRDVEMPLVTVLADMEEIGVCLDTDVLADMSREMTQAIGDLATSIYNRAGRNFNINSTQQLSQLLFQELKLPSGRRTKTGHSTDNEVLEALRDRHPIVGEILEYRQLLKLKNTYVDALPSLINSRTGRVHTDFNQTVAATGRLSSSNPNLQNIPIRGELGRKIRRAFVPSRKENLLLAADYSQIELRILAALSKDPRLVDAFVSREDVHRATAAAVFGVPLENVTADQRRIAKVVNFGIIYGIGEQRLAHETGISRSEAAEFIASYNRTYAGVKSFMDDLRKRAAFQGYVTTLLGRRRDIPEIHSNHQGIRAAAERAAINMPIQGTAADIIKVAMIRLHAGLAERYPNSSMVLQVHDELVFDVPATELPGVAELASDLMANAMRLDVPLEVELHAGHDWYDMAPLEPAA
jgi:DNA polymerase-1